MPKPNANPEQTSEHSEQQEVVNTMGMQWIEYSLSNKQ